MKTEFLVALVYPRAIAVHPNFTSQTKASPATALASRILGDRGPGIELDSDEGRFSTACMNAYAAEGYDDLDDLAEYASRADLDFSMRACAGILVTSMSLEVGQPRPQVLSALLDDLEDAPGTEGQLARAWVRLGLASVGSSLGLDPRTELLKVRTALAEIEPEQFVDFPIVGGLDLNPALVVKRVVEFLDHSAMRLASSFDGFDGDSWMEQVRTPTPQVLNSVFTRMYEGYSEWVKDSFQQSYQPGIVRLGGSEIPGDQAMVTALSIVGCAFHPAMESIALQLGRERMIRSEGLEDEQLRSWCALSGLRLILTSRDKAAIAAATRSLVRVGPTAALLSGIASVMGSVEAKKFATTRELEFLSEASYVLDGDFAAQLLGAVADELEERVIPPFERWIAPWQRREILLTVCARLANTDVDSLVVARALVAGMPGAYSDRADRALAKAIGSLSDGIADGGIKRVLANWLTKNSEYVEAREQFEGWTSERLDTAEEPPEPQSNLMRAIELIDTEIRAARSVDRAQLKRQVPILREELARMRSSASSGSYSFGGPSVINVCAAYVLTGGMSELWPDVVDAVCDPAVSRDERTPALERIARHANDLDPHLATALSGRASELLTAPSGMLEVAISPFPAALRVVAAFRLVPDAELLGLTAALSMASGVEARIEGVRVVASIHSRIDRPEWALQSALIATYDRNARVKAEGVRALALLFRESDPLAALIRDRINDLLDSDGASTALLLLSSISGDRQESLRKALRSRVVALGRHPDWRVRQMVATVLDAFEPDVI